MTGLRNLVFMASLRTPAIAASTGRTDGSSRNRVARQDVSTDPEFPGNDAAVDLSNTGRSA